MLADYVLLCAVAMLAGAINAVAGGGTLLTFPALYAALGSSGEAAVIANATSTVALVPGAVAALAGYADEIRRERRWVVVLLVPSLLGGVLGSLLLIKLPSETFKDLVPWLILVAALLFALQQPIARWVGIGRRSGADATGAVRPPSEQATGEASATDHDARPPPRRFGLLAAVVVFQFFVAVYGGYFGAGIGILMLTRWPSWGWNTFTG